MLSDQENAMVTDVMRARVDAFLADLVVISRRHRVYAMAANEAQEGDLAICCWENEWTGRPEMPGVWVLNAIWRRPEGRYEVMEREGG